MNSESVINQIDEIHRLSKDALTQKKNRPLSCCIFTKYKVQTV
jgi:hypothetical protein